MKRHSLAPSRLTLAQRGSLRPVSARPATSRASSAPASCASARQSSSIHSWPLDVDINRPKHTDKSAAEFVVADDPFVSFISFIIARRGASSALPLAFHRSDPLTSAANKRLHLYLSQPVESGGNRNRAGSCQTLIKECSDPALMKKPVPTHTHAPLCHRPFPCHLTGTPFSCAPSPLR